MKPVAQNKIEALRTRRAQIDAELSRLEAQTRAEMRKQDTRRKILLGAVIFQEMKDRPDFYLWVKKVLDKRLTKPRDRSLFGLDFDAPN